MKTIILATFRWFLFPFSFFMAPLARLYINRFPFRFGKVLTWKFLGLLGKTFQVEACFGSMINGRTDDVVQRCIYCFGVWERDLTHFIRSRAVHMEGRVFVDVGANIGYYSMLVASVSRKINVISVEPFPSIFKKLNVNVEQNFYSNVTTINVAVVEKRRPVPMYYAGALNEGSTTFRPGIYNSKPVVVEGLPLSEILSESELALIRFIKIDTEGAEYAVLKGMESILDKLPEDVEVVVEINPGALVDSQVAEIFEMFDIKGFSAYQIRNPFGAENYLFHDGACIITKLISLPVTMMDVLFSKNEVVI